MERRKFIQQTAAVASLTAIGGLTLPSFAKKKKHITILHTNDTHSHVEPFEASHYKYANKGGVARRATLVEDVRKENPNTLLLDAGDIFQGTPYFNYFGGEQRRKARDDTAAGCAPHKCFRANTRSRTRSRPVARSTSALIHRRVLACWLGSLLSTS